MFLGRLLLFWSRWRRPLITTALIFAFFLLSFCSESHTHNRSKVLMSLWEYNIIAREMRLLLSTLPPVSVWTSWYLKLLCRCRLTHVPASFSARNAFHPSMVKNMEHVMISGLFLPYKESLIWYVMIPEVSLCNSTVIRGRININLISHQFNSYQVGISF